MKFLFSLSLCLFLGCCWNHVQAQNCKPADCKKVVKKTDNSCNSTASLASVVSFLSVESITGQEKATASIASTTKASTKCNPADCDPKNCDITKCTPEELAKCKADKRCTKPSEKATKLAALKE